MKLHLGLLALQAAHEVAGGALFGGVLTSQELVEELIQRPNLLPENSRWTPALLGMTANRAGRRMLDARFQEFNRTLSSSKQPPPNSPAPATGGGTGNGLTVQDYFTMFIYGVASAFTQNQRGKVAPISKVPEMMDSPSPEFVSQHPGAKQRKIRYGPYRIPSNTVRLPGTSLHIP
jgi:hypothetical protein